MALGGIAPALLEDWFRDRYFAVRLDVSSSGVENYSLGDLRRLLGISVADLDRIVFRDSPSQGDRALTEAIAARVAVADPDRVMVSHGSSEAIFLALSALLRPGDEVVVPAPAYQSLTSTVEALDARPVEWELRAEEDFAPDLLRLRALLTPRTRLVVVNFPHNPTGATLDETGYAELIDMMAGHPGYLLWDGSMSELVYTMPRLPDPASVLDRCVSTGSLSKGYGLPGVRIGWCVAPAELIPAMVRLRDYTTISSSPLMEFIAAAVMREADAIVGPRLLQAAENRRILLDWVDEHRHLVTCPLPQGGVTAFPRFLGVADTRERCERLAEHRGVLVVPGDCFGHPDRVRIGFGGPTSDLVAGLIEVAAAFA